MRPATGLASASPKVHCHLRNSGTEGSTIFGNPLWRSLRPRKLRIAPHVTSFLILTQSNEPRMPQVCVGRPLDEFKLPNQLWFQPPALLHLFSREALAPATALGLRQIGERALCHFESLESAEQLFARCRREAIAGARDIDQSVAFIVAEDDRIEVFGTWGVPTVYNIIHCIHSM